jgi:hypothetical protein
MPLPWLAGVSRLSPKLRISRRGVLQFWCPACDAVHGISIDPPPMGRAAPAGQPTWNGNVHAPTVSPDIVVGSCHFSITAGQIEFLPDSEHEFAGQTVAMIDFPEDASS